MIPGAITVAPGAAVVTALDSGYPPWIAAIWPG